MPPCDAMTDQRWRNNLQKSMEAHRPGNHKCLIKGPDCRSPKREMFVQDTCEHSRLSHQTAIPHLRKHFLHVLQQLFPAASLLYSPGKIAEGLLNFLFCPSHFLLRRLCLLFDPSNHFPIILFEGFTHLLYPLLFPRKTIIPAFSVTSWLWHSSQPFRKKRYYCADRSLL